MFLSNFGILVLLLQGGRCTFSVSFEAGTENRRPVDLETSAHRNQTMPGTPIQQGRYLTDFWGHILPVSPSL